MRSVPNWQEVALTLKPSEPRDRDTSCNTGYRSGKPRTGTWTQEQTPALRVTQTFNSLIANAPETAKRKQALKEAVHIQNYPRVALDKEVVFGCRSD